VIAVFYRNRGNISGNNAALPYRRFFESPRRDSEPGHRVVPHNGWPAGGVASFVAVERDRGAEGRLTRKTLAA